MKCLNCKKEVPYYSPNKNFCCKQCETTYKSENWDIDFFKDIFWFKN